MTSPKRDSMNINISPRWNHDDVIKCKHFPRNLPCVRGIHRSPVNSPHRGHWRGALMFSLICTLIERLSKQSWGWWSETLSRPLWRHCNEMCSTCLEICTQFCAWFCFASSLLDVFVNIFEGWRSDSKDPGSTSIWHRSDTFASDRYLIDVDPRVFALWTVGTSCNYPIASVVTVTVCGYICVPGLIYAYTKIQLLKL